MFAGMEVDPSAKLVKRSKRETYVHRTEHLKEENPDTVDKTADTAFGFSAIIRKKMPNYRPSSVRASAEARFSLRRDQYSILAPTLHGHLTKCRYL